MKIIDAHMHLSHIASFKETAENRSFVDYSVDGLLREYAENGVVLGIGMGGDGDRRRRLPRPGSPDANGTRYGGIVSGADRVLPRR